MPTRKDRHSRHARAVLLWAVALYGAVQLTAGLLLDYRWPLLRFPSAAYRMIQLSQQSATPDVVTLGSSRFGAGIVPREISTLLNSECQPSRPIGIFNASVPAGDPISAEFMLHRLLDRGVRPRLLLVEISPETLNRAHEWFGAHVRRQLRWHEAPGAFVDICRSLQIVRWAGERANPIYSHREALWQEAAAAFARIAGDGWVPPSSTQTWEDLLGRNSQGGNECGVASATRPNWDALVRLPQGPATPEALEMSRNTVRLPRHMLAGYHIAGGHPAAALERLLATCRTRSIAVILVGVPVTRMHRDEYTPAIDHQYRAYLNRVTREFDCRFVDYRDRLPDCLFWDIHHLNGEGGLCFSRLLTHELLAPFFGPNSSPRDQRLGHAKSIGR